LLGARSEIAGAVIMFSIFEIAMSRKPRQALLVTALIIGILGLLLFSLIDWLEYLYPDNRLLTLLLRQEADGSLQERAIQHALAWDAILAKPILGDYGHYAKELSAGAYAHSWISAWVDLGIMGLLLFLLLYVALFRIGLALYQASIDSKHTVMRRYCSVGLGLLLMTVTFSIFAKTFTDTSIAMVAGLLAGIHLNLTRHASQAALRTVRNET
jgi:O-antigen ligase